MKDRPDTALAEARHSLRMAQATRCDACDGCEYATCECEFIARWVEEAKGELDNVISEVLSRI